MRKQDLLNKIAPCSLMCHTCSAYCEGVICEASKKLLKYTKGLDEFYAKNVPSEVEKHNIFLGELTKYSNGLCNGCREGGHNGCSIAGCVIPECTKERKVDFCGECELFPCNKVEGTFEGNVYRQWLEGNQKIKEQGIEQFWKENSEKSHYSSYIEQD